MKTYKLRSLATENGEGSSIDLMMEFEGKRAFIIWDTINLGDYLLKARMEIDPRLLEKVQSCGCDYLYRGEIILPRPQNN